MKVLNWVTRRFLNVQSCIAVVPVSEKDYMNSKYDIEETQALLKHGAHFVMDNDTLQDWKDGILAIGTIAISPLDTQLIDDDEEIENYSVYDNLEENPLMNVTLLSHELEKDVPKDNVLAIEDTEEVSKDEWLSVKKRVTLAELLFQDSDHKLVKQLGVNKLHHQDDYGNDITLDCVENPCLKTIKHSSRTKQGLFKAKKLLKEDLSPVKKINQLMKRMMKKKIHPDMGGKIPPDMEMHHITQKESQILIQGTHDVA